MKAAVRWHRRHSHNEAYLFQLVCYGCWAILASMASGPAFQIISPIHHYCIIAILLINEGNFLERWTLWFWVPWSPFICRCDIETNSGTSTKCYLVLDADGTVFIFSGCSRPLFFHSDLRWLAIEISSCAITLTKDQSSRRIYPLISRIKINPNP